uniref:Uncharacterized protein n=1 Tax=Arundo donax TaxID=35708 RepID=A0A0A9EZU0_ARUDO
MLMVSLLDASFDERTISTKTAVAN